MASKRSRKQSASPALRKAAASGGGIRKKETGIVGFDQITGGGLPVERLTAIVGGAGTGKSLMALRFLVHQLKINGAHGLYVTFEEPVDRINQNIASLDWDFGDMDMGRLSLIDARLPPDAVQSGNFDLSGLLAGLSARKAENGATDVIFDGIDLLLSALNDEVLERRELARIDDWIRSEGVTAVLTVKSYGSSERDQTRADLIQYLTDCVVLLEAELFEKKLSRTIRVVKYRGSGFVANAVPLIIGSSGIDVVPAEGLRRDYPVNTERISIGVARLDAILQGGLIRGSSILLTGAPGTAKTSLATSLVRAGCAAGHKALFVSFDENGAQIVANLKSVGIDLRPFVDSGKLLMASLRSAASSPEECFLRIADLVRDHRPDILVVDPISAFVDTSHPFAQAITENLIDYIKSRGITFLFTSLLGDVSGDIETSVSNVSTIADTWLHLSYVAQRGERNRALTIIKSRGTAHSNQVRELSLDANGIDLIDVFVGEGEVLLGSARLQKEAELDRLERLRFSEHQRQMFGLNRDIEDIKARISVMSGELGAKEGEIRLAEAEEALRMAASEKAAVGRSAARRKSEDHTGVAKSQRGRNR